MAADLQLKYSKVCQEFLMTVGLKSALAQAYNFFVFSKLRFKIKLSSIDYLIICSEFRASIFLRPENGKKSLKYRSEFQFKNCFHCFHGLVCEVFLCTAVLYLQLLPSSLCHFSSFSRYLSNIMPCASQNTDVIVFKAHCCNLCS